MKLKNKSGFTLSEVLITLTVIGIVAALTIPTLQANYTREAASSKLKKFYSVINQVAIRARVDGLDWNDWADTADTVNQSTFEVTKDFVDTYILPYMSYYKTESKGAFTYVYLDDGTYFWTYKGGCLDFIFDTNGAKRPNKEGRDIFRFLYCPYSNSGWIGSGRVIPYQPKNVITREAALAKCKENGMYCSALLAIDGWQFKKDYPWGI